MGRSRNREWAKGREDTDTEEPGKDNEREQEEQRTTGTAVDCMQKRHTRPPAQEMKSGQEYGRRW